MLALVAGINLVLLGIIQIIDAVTGDVDEAGRVLVGIVGLISVIAGLVVIRRPGESLLALIVVLGIWFVISGILHAVRVLTGGERGWAGLVAGVVDVVLGALILALPELSLKTLAVLVGIGFIVRGLVGLVAGMAFRKAERAERPAAA